MSLSPNAARAARSAISSVSSIISVAFHASVIWDPAPAPASNRAGPGLSTPCGDLEAPPRQESGRR